MAQNQGNNNKERPLYSMSPLEVTEPTRSGEFWLATAATTILFRNKYAPNPPVNVVFKVDDEEVERVLTGEESGRVVCEIPITAAGGHIIYAWLERFPEVRRSKIITAKKESETPKPKPIPHSLKVEANGSNGKYALSVFVADKEEKPVKGAPVIFAPEDDFMNHTKALTNKNGAIIQSVTITSMERFMVVMVKGTKLTERIHLFGPISRPARIPKGRSLVLWQ